MPSSFDAMHEETRPLSLLDKTPQKLRHPRTLSLAAVLGVIAAVLVLVL